MGLNQNIEQYVFNTTYTKAQWISAFKASKLFQGPFPIMNGSTDVTDDILSGVLEVAMQILPGGIIDYQNVDSMKNVLNYTVAHVLTFFDYKDDYAEVKSLVRNASSRSADGLSISYQEVSKMKSADTEMMSSLNDFFNTTPYGRMVCLYLEQMVGPVGAFVV